jgi:hypothetical protein
MPQSLFYEEPTDDEPVWRYLRYSRYEQMIRERILFFSRLDHFEDKFEGTIPQANEEERDAYFRSQGIREEYLRPNPGSLGVRLFEVFRATTYANCWRRDNQESAWAWNQYCSNTGSAEGVAVLSTVGALRRAIEVPSLQFLIAPVQ